MISWWSAGHEQHRSNGRVSFIRAGRWGGGTITRQGWGWAGVNDSARVWQLDLEVDSHLSARGSWTIITDHDQQWWLQMVDGVPRFACHRSADNAYVHAWNEQGQLISAGLIQDRQRRDPWWIRMPEHGTAIVDWIDGRPSGCRLLASDHGRDQHIISDW